MRIVVAVVTALMLLLGAIPGQAQSTDAAGQVELVGIFHAGGEIRGAVIHDGYIYVSTPDRLSIYSFEDPANPELVSMVPSPRLIHGELLSTNGELLLLNEQAAITSYRTVDVWDVEDKSNPKLVGTIPSIPDEHMSCILDCKWAYGSEGTILDLRDRTKPKRRDENWIELAGLKGLDLHRVDEFRHGEVVTGPRGWPPMTFDVRDPLRPRLTRQTSLPIMAQPGFLYSDLPSDGRNRYLFTSTEFPDQNDCSNRWDGALVAFDLNKRRAPLVSRFAAQIREGCTGFYFSFHPKFEKTGLIALPQSLGGVAIVRFEPKEMVEEARFYPVIADVWLTFWIDTEFFYALSKTGEIYILRYVP